jgi:hypothetical protein
MPLSAGGFIRRCLLHILPSGFLRIRYYGFLGNRHRKEKLQRCRQLLGMAPPKENSTSEPCAVGRAPPAVPRRACRRLRITSPHARLCLSNGLFSLCRLHSPIKEAGTTIDGVVDCDRFQLEESPHWETHRRTVPLRTLLSARTNYSRRHRLDSMSDNSCNTWVQVLGLRI